MNKPDVFMPLYIGDYLAGTSRLTTELHGAYMLLIMDYWMNGPLPDNDIQLAAITRMPPDAWSIARASLEQFFSIENGEWKHKRVEEELAKAYDKKRMAKEKAEKAAAARWAKEEEKRKKAAKDASSNAPSIPQAMHEECPSPSPSPSQVSPSEREGESDDPPPPPPKKTKRFVKPSVDEVFDYMISQGMDSALAGEQSQRFIDHYTSNGWKVGGKAPMKDWQAAVRSQWLKPKFDSGAPRYQTAQERRAARNAEIFDYEKATTF